MSTRAGTPSAKAEKEKRGPRASCTGPIASCSTVDGMFVPATSEANQAERHATQRGQDLGQDKTLLHGLNNIAEILTSGFGGMASNVADLINKSFQAPISREKAEEFEETLET